MKIVHAWNGHPEMFSLPEAIENSRGFVFFPIYLRFSQHGLKKYVKLTFALHAIARRFAIPVNSRRNWLHNLALIPRWTKIKW